MTTGERIKKRREFLGLTAEQVAKKMGVSRATYYRYESDAIEGMRAKALEPLSRALHTTPAELLGWGEEPEVTEDVVEFPVLGEMAAGYDRIAVMDDMDTSEKITVPASYLRGRPSSDYFVLRVVGNSMYPLYLDGDIVLVLRQSTLNHSGQIGVVLYNDEYATLKKVEYVMGEDWMRLVPLNLNGFMPELVEGEKLEHCRVLGIPRKLLRDIDD